MKIRCPHCQNAVEVLDESSLRDIECSTCGSSFDLVVDQTESFTREETKRFGHFELVEKLGLGAFGTVWKARDTKLDRTVAVKIPRKEQLTEKDTEQFFREARAAAQLKHPSIVGVHEVGRHDDTIYIVSDFVHGLTLSDWLTGQRPTIRAAVELTAKISAALHVAHEKGIVHRDLKPSNIMLDDSNNPHVMDFGLAKREAGEITMTVEGQVLGTPAYMAPEQARGEAHKADRRADIYALGVILFELLTGEKPFRGNTRMLLHQVLNEEAPSPRKLNSNVPADLETITLRCLQKEPSRRFQTASELGDELGRFLAGEPVLSRPIGRLQRGFRWCKRNPMVASLVSSIALLLVVGITVVSWLWLRAEAVAASEKAARAEVVLEKKRADENFERAQNVVDEFFTDVSDSKELLRGTPGTQELRLELLQKAVKYYETFLAENDSREVNAKMAAAHHRLGTIRFELRLLEEAEQSFLKAKKASRELMEKNPNVLEFENNLVSNSINLGLVYSENGNPDKAIRQYEMAIDISKRLVAENPTEPVYQSNLASSYDNLGRVYRDKGSPEEAIRQHQLAIGIREQLVADNPNFPDFANDLATSLVNQGLLFVEQDNPEASIRQYELAIEISERLVAEYPTAPEYQSALAVGYINLGIVYRQLGKPEEAIEQNELAKGISARLVADNPTVPVYKNRLASCINNLALVYSKNGKPEEAIRQYEQSISISEQLVADIPTVLEYQHKLASSYVNLGLVYSGMGNTAEVIRQYKLAIGVSERLVAENPTVPECQYNLASRYIYLGGIYTDSSEPEEAMRQYELAKDIAEQLVSEYPTVPEYGSQLGGSCVNIAISHMSLGNFAEGLELLEDARLHLGRVLERNPRDATATEYLSNANTVETQYRNAVAWILSTSSDASVRNGEQAVEEATRACELTEWKVSRYIETLAAAYAEVGDFEKAIEFQQKAIELVPEGSRTEHEEVLADYQDHKPRRRVERE